MKRSGDVVNKQVKFDRQPLPDFNALAPALMRTYTQAPWRRQMQFIGLFILVLVIIALIAAVYLSISARTTAAGRAIQEMQQKITDLDQEIEDQQARLAFLNSTAEMNRRAREMGFKPMPADRVVYLPIPGYTERQPAVLASYTRHPLVGAAAIPAEYTESLFEWLMRMARR